MANIYRSGVCMISAVICMSPRWVDTFVICLVFMHCLGSFLFKYMNSSLHEFAFERRKHAIRLSRDILMFLATIWSSLCFSCSMYKFLPLLVVLAPRDSNAAVYAQVYSLFRVLYMSLFGFVQGRPCGERRTRTKMLFVIRICLLCLQTVLITTGPGATK